MKLSPSKFNFFNISYKPPMTICFKGLKSDCFIESSSSKDSAFKKNLNNIINSSNEELFIFAWEEFYKKAKENNISSLLIDDFVHRKILEIIEFSQNAKDKEELKNFILNSYNNFKLIKCDFVRLFELLSLDKFLQGSNIKCGSILSDKNIPKSLSAPSEEERLNKKKELEIILDKSKLSKEEKELLLMKFILNKSYRQIAKETGDGDTYVYRKIKTILLKIQQKTDNLPREFCKYSENFQKRFYADKKINEIQNFLIENPYLIGKNLYEIENKISVIVQEFSKYGYICPCFE